LPLRQRSVRDHGTARLGRVLPLHPLPATNGHGGIGAGTSRIRIVPLTSGAELVTEYDPADGGFLKAFCSTCGSALYSRHPTDPDAVSVRLGTFDSDPDVEPAYHQFVAYAASWEAIPDDGLPRYPERRPIA